MKHSNRLNSPSLSVMVARMSCHVTSIMLSTGPRVDLTLELHCLSRRWCAAARVRDGRTRQTTSGSKFDLSIEYEGTRQSQRRPRELSWAPLGSSGQKGEIKHRMRSMLGFMDGARVHGPVTPSRPPLYICRRERHGGGSGRDWQGRVALALCPAP
jgi:hypothetical protein